MKLFQTLLSVCLLHTCIAHFSHPAGRRRGHSQWRSSLNIDRRRSLAASGKGPLTPALSMSGTGCYSPGLAFIDPRSIGALFNSWAASNPYAAAALSCACNGVMADFLAQSSERYQRRREEKLKPVSEVVTSLEGGSQDQVVSSPVTEEAIEDGPSGETTSSASTAVLVSTKNDPVQAKAPSSLRVSPSQPFWQVHDFRRTLAFLMYGACYQGATLHFIYNDLFVRWFGPSNPILKTMVSQFIMAPFLTLPTAYVFKGLVFGKAPPQAILDYLVGVREKGLLFSFWKLWIPVQMLVFTVIPPHLRMPFSSLFSFCWTVLLSRISNSTR